MSEKIEYLCLDDDKLKDLYKLLNVDGQLRVKLSSRNICHTVPELIVAADNKFARLSEYSHFRDRSMLNPDLSQFIDCLLIWCLIDALMQFTRFYSNRFLDCSGVFTLKWCLRCRSFISFISNGIDNIIIQCCI